MHSGPVSHILNIELFSIFEDAFAILTVYSQDQVDIHILCGPEINLKAILTFITFILNIFCQDQVAIQMICIQDQVDIYVVHKIIPTL